MDSRLYLSAKFRIILTVIILLLISASTLPQEQDTAQINAANDIRERIENIAESTDEALDYSDLVGDLEYLKENPLNLNFASASDLDKLIFLNEIQKFSLLAYRENYGNFATLYELQSIEGFDAETIRKILPFVYVSAEKPKFRITFKDVMNYGRNECILRYQRVLEEQQGYLATDDSAYFENPNSRYLGSPDKIYLKYRFNYFDKIKFGFVTEKDAGEPFLKSNVNDSIQQIARTKLKNGFDFYSFHLNLNDFGFLKALSVGDYQLEFGQGLTLWSGLAFGKSSGATDVKRFARGIRPSASANENLFFRGAAATFEIKKLDITAFYSGHKIDANLSDSDSLDSESIYITSIQESGLHRTPNELHDKHAINSKIFGTNLSYRGNWFGLGLTSYYSQLNQSLSQDLQPYNKFEFSGTGNLNSGLDYTFLINKFNFFGEISHSQNGGIAQLHGVTAGLHPSLLFTVLYRNYQKDYQNFFSNAFAEGSENCNEKGLYAGITLRFRGQWTLTSYIDSYRFPWLKYRVDAPSQGNEYLLKVQKNFSEKGLVSVQFRQKNKQINEPDIETGNDPQMNTRKNYFRFQAEYNISPAVILKNRLEYVLCREANDYKGTGYLACQDIGWKSPSQKVSLAFRYAVFDTDSYEERMYAYENDVLYSFSVPAYYYKGSRIYLVAHYSITPHLDFWIRVSQTYYSDLNTIGSGLDEIEGNHKTEIKAQCRIKF